MNFTYRDDEIEIGKSIGNVDDLEFKILQIRKAIEEHLDKELILNKKGIKVLTLFFIDRVSNYRYYDEEGNSQKGIYAQIFEEEYSKLIKKDKYNTLFENIEKISPEKVHNGYFSVDKKGKVKDTKGNTQADEDTYSLIMKDKEKLLNLNEPLKFIFSHSALREGWDNPNVFQICTLNETGSTIKKRQEIGRGLRLCVNQDGERVFGHALNVLTIIANESYEEFAAKLQKEIEEDEGIKFGVVEKHIFANISFLDEKGNKQYLGTEKSEELWDSLLESNYIDSKGKVTDSLRIDLKNDALNLPEEFEPFKAHVSRALKKVAGKLEIKNANERKKIDINRQKYESPEFKELWDRIKYKTYYRVEFDVEKLIERCSNEIRTKLIIPKPKFQYEKGLTDISKSGVNIIKSSTEIYTFDENIQTLPDIVSHLQNETNLTRKTIAEILVKSKRLKDFKKNPQKFIDGVTQIIKNIMIQFLVDGIKYEKIGENSYYLQELFKNEELYGYLKSNMIESQKSVYTYTVYDSGVEAQFAKDCELDKNVKVYTKLPSWFKISTPLGTYNPDWAVLIEKNGEEKIYFVVETKGGILPVGLRVEEQAKIDCGKEHFKTIGNDVKFEVANKLKKLYDLL